MRAPSGERLSAACSRSSSACSCAIRVNCMRNSRSALARRCPTDSDWAVERRSNRAGEAGVGDTDRNLSDAMTNTSDRRQCMTEVRPMGVLNRTRAVSPGRLTHERLNVRLRTSLVRRSWYAARRWIP
jgi:hypothetical protein